MSFSASVNCKTRSSSQISSNVQRERPAILLQICVSDKPISSPSSLPVRINARPIAPRTARSRSFRRRVNCCGFSILPFPFSRATISTDTISCGEICPTRPARCCNIGRGIFLLPIAGFQQRVHGNAVVLCQFLDLARVRAAHALFPVFDRRLRYVDFFCKTIIRLATLSLQPSQILRETQFINSFLSVAPFNPIVIKWSEEGR